MTKNHQLPRLLNLVGQGSGQAITNFQLNKKGLAPLEITPTLCRSVKSLTGFTLVEILIAVAISSIIFLSIISTYSLTLRTLGRWGEREENYYLARNIFRRMNSEISSVYFLGDSQVVSVQEEKTDYNGLEGSEKTLSFYSTTSSLYFPFSCLTKITYKFIAENEDEKLLIREEEPLVNFTLEENFLSKSYVYSDSLKDFGFQYYDGKDWHDSWDIEKTEQTLRAVRIEIVSASDEKFSTVIYLPGGI